MTDLKLDYSWTRDDVIAALNAFTSNSLTNRLRALAIRKMEEVCGVRRLSDVKPEDYGKFIVALESTFPKTGTVVAAAHAAHIRSEAIAQAALATFDRKNEAARLEREHDAKERQLDVGRGRLPKRMLKPTIYFAGRMNGSRHGDDWRNYIDGFDGGLYGCSDKGFDCDAVIDCGAFRYGGPFVMDSCGNHASGHTWNPGEHREIWDIDRFQIERADLIFAYLEDANAYGTLVEIGYASALGKPIALGFSTDMARQDYDELWLARMPAARVYWGTPAEVWSWVKADWIRQPA
jgi:Nucleoside 2-deoxyribosyltransferase